jgi:hypothetical protein
MRYGARSAIGSRCTEHTAWRAAAIAAVAVIAACRGNAAEERGQSQASAVDTRGTRAGDAASASAKPLCPPTGAWQLCSVVERLDRAGLAPQQQPGRVVEPPLSPAGVAMRLGKSELRIFLYADRATREREQSRLDATKYVSASQPLSMRVEPTLIVSENLLAILRSRSDQQRERVSDALTAGPPQKPSAKG